MMRDYEPNTRRITVDNDKMHVTATVRKDGVEALIRHIRALAEVMDDAAAQPQSNGE